MCTDVECCTPISRAVGFAADIRRSKSSVRYHGIEVDDTIGIAEKIDI